MQSEKNHITKSARLIAVLCVALIFSGCLADSAANSGSAAVSTSEAAQVPNYDEKQFSDYVFMLSRFVTEPVSSAEDLKDMDLFFLLVFEAEKYAKANGETFAAAEESAYRFPLKALQELSKNLFGFEIDFTQYKDKTYFEQNGYLADYFDNEADEFFIIFAGAFYPALDNDVFVDLHEIKSIEINANEITAGCQLEYSHGLGTAVDYKNIMYQFEIVEKGNEIYYRLKTAKSADGNTLASITGDKMIGLSTFQYFNVI